MMAKLDALYNAQYREHTYFTGKIVYAVYSKGNTIVVLHPILVWIHTNVPFTEAIFMCDSLFQFDMR